LRSIRWCDTDCYRAANRDDRADRDRTHRRLAHHAARDGDPGGDGDGDRRATDRDDRATNRDDRAAN
jgi:hypothetical protein